MTSRVVSRGVDHGSCTQAALPVCLPPIAARGLALAVVPSSMPRGASPLLRVAALLRLLGQVAAVSVAPCQMQVAAVSVAPCQGQVAAVSVAPCLTWMVRVAVVAVLVRIAVEAGGAVAWGRRRLGRRCRARTAGGSHRRIECVARRRSPACSQPRSHLRHRRRTRRVRPSRFHPRPSRCTRSRCSSRCTTSQPPRCRKGSLTISCRRGPQRMPTPTAALTSAPRARPVRRRTRVCPPRASLSPRDRPLARR